MTIISKVPRDVINFIFLSYLDPVALRKCAKVCKAFQQIILKDSFLKSLFRDVVLPERMTVQQWLFQGIHSKEELLRCVKYYFAQAAQGKVTNLTFRTVNNASIEIQLGYGTIIFRGKVQRKTTVWTAADVLPSGPGCKTDAYYLDTGAFRKSSMFHSKVTGMQEDYHTPLLQEIKSIIAEQVSPQKSSNNHALAVTVGVLSVAVVIFHTCDFVQ